MLAAARRRAARATERFVRRRTPTQTLPLQIPRRRLYILPTRSGGIFALLLVVMLLGATNYSNSLGFALTFWLGAIALISMHHAHRNLLGLDILAVRAADTFAGQSARVEIELANDSRRARRALRVSAQGATDAEARVDVAPGGRTTLVLELPQHRRGHVPCPRLRLDSVYPLGLFCAWSYAQPATEIVVYPRSAGTARLPEPAGDEAGRESPTAGGDEEFGGHRRYRPGDSPRRVDWKASARSDDVLVREYLQPRAATLWLDEERAPGRDREARLSQLVRWVLSADRAGLDYGLRVGATEIAPAQGPTHRRACLRALADA